MKNPVKPEFSRKLGFKVSGVAKVQHAEACAKARAEGKREPSPLYGSGVDSDFLPHNVRNALLKVLKDSALDPPQQEKLVAYANELAQMPEGQTEAIADQRAQILKIARDAETLLASLRVLTTEATGTLRMYADEASVVPPSPLSGELMARVRELGPAEFMSQTWDLLDALKRVAEYASEQMESGGKPLESRQRAMVASLATRHYQMAGKYPPKDTSAWFARFSRILGGVMGLHFEDGNAKPIGKKPFIGGRIPGTGIELAAAPFFTDEEM